MTSTTTTINRGDSTNSFSSVSSNVAYPGKLEDLLKNLNFRQEFCEFLGMCKRGGEEGREE